MNGGLAELSVVIGLGLSIAACSAKVSRPAPGPTGKARHLADFAFLRLGMTYAEVVAVVGPADRLVGSGITGYMYELADGSRLSLVFDPSGSDLWRVILGRPDGTRQLILGQERPPLRPQDPRP
jgi:hypothetical protein